MIPISPLFVIEVNPRQNNYSMDSVPLSAAQKKRWIWADQVAVEEKSVEKERWRQWMIDPATVFPDPPGILKTWKIMVPSQSSRFHVGWALQECMILNHPKRFIALFDASAWAIAYGDLPNEKPLRWVNLNGSTPLEYVRTEAQAHQVQLPGMYFGRDAFTRNQLGNSFIKAVGLVPGSGDLDKWWDWLGSSPECLTEWEQYIQKWVDLATKEVPVPTTFAYPSLMIRTLWDMSPDFVRRRWLEKADHREALMLSIPADVTTKRYLQEMLQVGKYVATNVNYLSAVSQEEAAKFFENVGDLYHRSLAFNFAMALSYNDAERKAIYQGLVKGEPLSKWANEANEVYSTMDIQRHEELVELIKDALLFQVRHQPLSVNHLYETPVFQLIDQAFEFKRSAGCWERAKFYATIFKDQLDTAATFLDNEEWAQTFIEQSLSPKSPMLLCKLLDVFRFDDLMKFGEKHFGQEVITWNHPRASGKTEEVKLPWRLYMFYCLIHQANMTNFNVVGLMKNYLSDHPQDFATPWKQRHYVGCRTYWDVLKTIAKRAQWTWFEKEEALQAKIYEMALHQRWSSVGEEGVVEEVSNMPKPKRRL